MFYFLRNPQYDVVKLFFLIVAIIALGVFVVFNTSLRYNFNGAQVIDFVYPWGDATAEESITIAITDVVHAPVESDLLGVNLEAIFDTMDFHDETLNAFLDAAGFTNYRMPGAEANFFHPIDAVVPDQYKSCPSLHDLSGDPIFAMPLGALNHGNGHWPCQMFIYSPDNSYAEDVSQGTYQNQTTIGHNYLEDFAPMATRIDATNMFTINPSTGTVSDVLSALGRLKALGVDVKYVELGEEHYIQADNAWYCDTGCTNGLYKVADYVARVEPYAQAIRDFDPSIVIAANAAPYWKVGLNNNISYKNWNNGLANAMQNGTLTADAITTHYYPPVAYPPSGSSGSQVCGTLGGIDALMDCARASHAINDNELVIDTIEYYQALMPGKEILFTEYNTEIKTTPTEGLYSNTLLQAIFVGGFLNTINAYNAAHPGTVPVADIHAISTNLFGPIGTLDGPEGFVDSVGDWDEINNTVTDVVAAGTHKDDAVRRMTYWPIQFMNTIVENNASYVDASVSTSNDTDIISDDTNPYLRVDAYRGEDGKYFVYVTNLSGVSLGLRQVGDTAPFVVNNEPINIETPITYAYIAGDHLYAGRGNTNLKTDGYIDANETAVVYKDVDTTLGSLYIPAYSFGYFVFDPNQMVALPADTTPPSVPSNLVVQSTTPTSAVLSWDASTDDSGNVAEYTVYQITDDGGEEEEIPVCDPDVAGTPGELRYCNEIFTQSEIPEPSVALGTAGIEFSSTYDLAFDLYTPPLSDTARNRPLKIFMHGGGGESEGGAAPCNEAARLGYVCISGDYRTDHTNMGFTMSEQKHAASDMLALIRFARLHATDYGIDPNKIILAGTSAGGITSMLAATTANDASFYPSSDTLVNRDNQTYQSGGIVPSWSCMVTSTSGPLAPFAYNYIDANDPPSVFFLGGEDTTHGWHCSDPDDAQNDDGDEALGIMQSFGIPSYFQCFDDSGHGLGEDDAIDKIVIPRAYNELIGESCPQSYSNLTHIAD